MQVQRSDMSPLARDSTPFSGPAFKVRLQALNLSFQRREADVLAAGLIGRIGLGWGGSWARELELGRELVREVLRGGQDHTSVDPRP
eukprot:5804098-Pyramimonas_sp.AAC.1